MIVNTVTVSRDGWDWSLLWATVIATPLAALGVFFAAVTLRQGNRDRKNQYYLDILNRLLETLTLAPAGDRELAQAQVSSLPKQDVPELRKQIMEGRLPANEDLNQYMPELLAAIDKYK